MERRDQRRERSSWSHDERRTTSRHSTQGDRTTTSQPDGSAPNQPARASQPWNQAEIEHDDATTRLDVNYTHANPAGSTSRARTLGDIPSLPTTALPRAEGEDDFLNSSSSGGPRSRALARREAPQSQVIQPSPRLQQAKTKRHTRTNYRRTLTTSAFVLVAMVLALLLAVAQSLQSQHIPSGTSTTAAEDAATPPPSGTGPFTASAGAVVYLKPTPRPTPKVTYSNATVGSSSAKITTLTDVQPCHGGTMWVANISQWSVPPGCYSQVFQPNPADYPARAAVGYCNWWVEQNHLSNPTITQGGQIYIGTKPVAGAAVWFAPGVQGASSEGHWAQLVAISPGGYWLLISEMNFSWRGAGFGRVDYRYVHVGPGLAYYK